MWCMHVKQDDQMTPAYYQAGVNGHAFSQTNTPSASPVLLRRMQV